MQNDTFSDVQREVLRKCGRLADSQRTSKKAAPNPKNGKLDGHCRQRRNLSRTGSAIRTPDVLERSQETSSHLTGKPHEASAKVFTRPREFRPGGTLTNR
jgi:hypothetical protein